MKYILFTVLLITGMANAQSTNIYDYSFTDIDGNEVSLKEFEGKKILFVNVASECGFTRQYVDLQELHKTHGDKLVLIGFPCNQFGGQEPGTEKEIQSFCKKNYGVDFLLASKIDVKGEEQHPIYKWLTSKDLNGVEDNTVIWNFNKFLVGVDGKFLQFYKSSVNPMSEKLTGLL